MRDTSGGLTPKNWADRLEQARLQILSDVRDGTVPATVGSFGDLHDYVDANEYGHSREEWQNGLLWSPSADESGWDEPGGVIYEMNALQTKLDAWIKDGGIGRAMLIEELRAGLREALAIADGDPASTSDRERLHELADGATN